MLRTWLWLSVIAGLVGCGGSSSGSDGGPDDAGGDTIDLDGSGSDGGDSDPGDGGTYACPVTAPDVEDLFGACCSRASNASQPNFPEMRISGLRLRSPSTLGNALVGGALNAALDEERFNWLVQFDLSADPPTIRTGLGIRADDGTFAFVAGTAPEPGDPHRWDPFTAEIAFDESTETMMGETIPDTVTVPIFEDTETMALSLELPLNSLALLDGILSEDRTCIGRRLPTRYDTTDGHLSTYIQVEDAMAGRVVIGGGAVDTTLCNFLAGMSGEQEENCDAFPREDWLVQPDSLCADGVCEQNTADMTDVCDPLDDCNAWKAEAEFAAHGVDITN